MSRAVISKHTPASSGPTTLEDDARPKRKHIMAGAEVPPIPDKERPLDLVLRDHAIAAWGELRGVFELDSARAEAILAAAMKRLLVSVRDDTEKFKKEIRDLQQAGSYVLGKLVKATSRPANNTEGDSRRRCTVCNQPVGGHSYDCPVKKGMERGLEAGFTVGVDS